MNKKPTGSRVEREARLKWVPLAKMKVNPLAQRDINPARVDKLASEMDLEQLGNPTVNHRDEWYYVLDGQHRVEAIKKWMGEDWNGQTIQCWTYEGLTEDEEAEKFLKLNDTLTVDAFAKFRVGVQAGRPEETDIDRIVRALGLRVSRDKIDGAISAVSTLRRVYRRSPKTLTRALVIIRDAYGDAGLESAVIDGIGLLCHRYNGELEDERIVSKLSSAMGGVNGLLNKAEGLRRQTGNLKSHCVAAGAVEIYNNGRGGKKLPSWWRTENGESS